MRWCAALVIVFAALFGSARVCAQGPNGHSAGFGIILGEPLGLTGKLWLSNTNAVVVDVGASYFGSPRVQVDYLWHMDTFRSRIIKLYAAPGVGLGFGGHSGIWYKDDGRKWYSHDDSFGLAIRCMVGVNIIPHNTPVEIFLELGPNIGIAPGFGAALDAAVGVRFYP